MDFLVDDQARHLVKSLAALLEEALVLVPVNLVLQEAIFFIDFGILNGFRLKRLTQFVSDLMKFKVCWGCLQNCFSLIKAMSSTELLRLMMFLISSSVLLLSVRFTIWAPFFLTKSNCW